MRTSPSLAAGIVLLSMASAAPAVAEGAPVDRVVVFSDRAQVTRVQKIKCVGGEARAVFFPLPPSLLDNTVRAEGRRGAVAIGTVLRRKPIEAAERSPRLVEARAAVKAVTVQIRALDAATSRALKRAQLIDKYVGFFGQLINEGVRSKDPDTATFEAVLNRVRKEHFTQAERKSKRDAERRILARTLARDEARVAVLDPAGKRLATEVEVALSCKSGTVEARLSYVVPGATWHPEYDLRFKATRGKVGPGRVEVGVSAVVQQSTGEPWANAQIVLSSARPWLGVQAPLPRRLTVTGAETKEGKVLVQARERRTRLSAGQRTTAAGPSSATLEDKGQSITLTLPQRITIDNDGRPYWMPVDRVKTKGVAKWVAIPKLSPFVFQVVQFSNPLPYPMLAGRLHTYRGNTYVGDTTLRHTGPGAPIEASLGFDDELKVERKSLSERDKDAGMLSGTKHMERAYEITVRNGYPRQVQVEVRENIPVSEIEDVRVEILREKTTKGFERDAERGLLSWTLKLKRGAKKAVKLAYTIHLPEDWKVQ